MSGVRQWREIAGVSRGSSRVFRPGVDFHRASVKGGSSERIWIVLTDTDENQEHQGQNEARTRR